jgi:hypothetical protein
MTHNLKQQAFKQTINTIKTNTINNTTSPSRHILKRQGFGSRLINDWGNWPLIICNAAGLSIILIFGFRKAAYHPDSIILPSSRNIFIQNETIRRHDLGYKYRDQTRMFARGLTAASTPIMLMLNNNVASSDAWSLNDTIDPLFDSKPLEDTSYFQDGLFNDVKPDLDQLPRTSTHRLG